jgi:hypothetical protein
MKTITVSASAKTLTALLKKARRRSLILESPDGERYVLAPIRDWEGFSVGRSQDFAIEVRRTARNKKLAQLMAERREQDKGKPRVSLKDFKKELGFE